MCICVYILQNRSSSLFSITVNPLSAQTHTYTHTQIHSYCQIPATVCAVQLRCSYGVAATSRLLKIICLFCKRDLSKRQYSAKETYNFKEPTNRSHPFVALRPKEIASVYGVATIGRLLKIKSLFCRISSLLQVSFAKETCNFKEPASRCLPIAALSSPPVSGEENTNLTQMKSLLLTTELTEPLVLGVRRMCAYVYKCINAIRCV